MLSSMFALYSFRSRHSFSFVSACRFRHGPVRSQRAIRGSSKRRIEIVTTAKVTSLTLVRFPQNSMSVHFDSSNTESALWETNLHAGDFEAARKGKGEKDWGEGGSGEKRKITTLTRIMRCRTREKEIRNEKPFERYIIE